jgi:hypothetical protein
MGLTPFRELPLSDKCRFCILVIFGDAPSRGGELKHKIAIDRMMGFLDNQIGEESNVKEK